MAGAFVVRPDVARTETPGRVRGYRGGMATTALGDSATPGSPAHPGPAAVRAATAEISDGMDHWDAMLDRLYAKGVASGSFDQLETFLADSWSLVARHRAGTLLAPANQRVSSDRFRAHVAAPHNDQQRAA